MKNFISNESTYSPIQPGFAINLPKYNEIKPHQKLLQNNISYFYEIITSTEELKSIPIIPDGCMDIIFVIDENSIIPYLIGTASSLVGLDASSNKEIFGIRFYPGGLNSFFPLMANEINSSQIPLELLCNKSHNLSQEIINASSFESRISIIESFFCKEILNSNGKEILIQYCVDKIISTNGTITINTLSENTGYSTRYINKLFNEYIGFSPKNFCEIVRLQSTIEYIRKHNNYTLTSVSNVYGYYDQSHMNKDFNKFLNITSGYIYDNTFFYANQLNLSNVYSF
ncbi:MAG: AraC family transcriptional regulator [Clostridiales bacterium]|nr:AraC family transcriptional regulator [Clostridiales bacterium]